ncbi:Uncharacterised protein [Chlamydia trachomatis]|nr:Uncharacterised protein [Chlamydia trachomatis]SYV91520.1 Uncharacterised protein [Mesomycoplasma hyorhinis]
MLFSFPKCSISAMEVGLSCPFWIKTVKSCGINLDLNSNFLPFTVVVVTFSQ